MAPKNILIEGVDLTGKSTISRKLADHLEYEVARNSWLKSNPYYKQAKDELKITPHSDKARKLLVQAIQFEIDNYDSTKTCVIQESTTLFRSLAYHYGIENKPMLDALNEVSHNYPHFYQVLLLVADEKTKLERLKERRNLKNYNLTDALIETDPDRVKKMEEGLELFLKKYYHKVYIIDTSLETPEQTVSRIKNILYEKNI